MAEVKDTARQLLLDLHGAGLSWVGIARQLGSSATAVKEFVHDRRACLAITGERGDWIRTVHKALCPERGLGP